MVRDENFTVKRYKLNPFSVEFNEIAAAFMESMMDEADVESIERIQNKHFWRRYMDEAA